MKKRLLAAGVAGAAAIAASLVAATAFGGSRAGGSILIGISAAKTGILAPYDLQAAQLFEMRIGQINKAGGVLGKQIKVQWIDTKSDKPTAATNAEELISKGAVAIIATCDFDYSFPAINAAHSHKIPASRSARRRRRSRRRRSSARTAARWVSDPIPRARAWPNGCGRRSRS